MKRIPLLLLTAFVGIGISSSTTSCSKSSHKTDSCLNYAVAPVESVEGSTSAKVNEPVLLTVNFRVSSGCGVFNNFETTKTSTGQDIKVNARYEGCVCTMDAPLRTTAYTFTPSNVGTYYLNFYSGGLTPVTHTIIVK